MFTTRTSATTALFETTSATAQTAHSANSVSRPTAQGPPKWLLGLTLSWLAFAFTLAAALVVPQLWRTTERKSAPQRGRKKDVDGQGERGRTRVMSSAVAPGDVDAGGFRKWKPRGLSVDTQTRGLGILVADGEARGAQQGKVEKRVSFDTTSTAHKIGAEAATAPLPSTKAFLQTLESAGSETDDDETMRCADIETGNPVQNPRDLGDSYAERRASPYSNADASLRWSGDDDEVEGKGWLPKVNQGVYKVADKLSARFYDQVNGAEEGLLLPVRENEREGFMGRIVH